MVLLTMLYLKHLYKSSIKILLQYYINIFKSVPLIRFFSIHFKTIFIFRIEFVFKCILYCYGKKNTVEIVYY